MRGWKSPPLEPRVKLYQNGSRGLLFSSQEGCTTTERVRSRHEAKGKFIRRMKIRVGERAEEARRRSCRRLSEVFADVAGEIEKRPGTGERRDGLTETEACRVREAEWVV